MGISTGFQNRTTAVSNSKKSVFPGKAGRIINPHEVTIINTDTAAHVVDFFNTTLGTTILYTMYVPSDGTTGGGSDYYEDNEISSWCQNMTAGSALAAASRDAVGGAGLEIIVRAEALMPFKTVSDGGGGGGGGGPTTSPWSTVLANGNTSGANDAIMSPSHTIRWALGGTYTWSAGLGTAEIVGPPDQDMIIAAGALAGGSLAGNNLQLWGGSNNALGIGGDINLNAGPSGVGQAGSILLTAGNGITNATSGDITFQSGVSVVPYVKFDRSANVILNASGGALVTATATNGWTYLPTLTTAGPPTLAPATLLTGATPIVIGSAGALWAYYAGAWNSVGGGSASTLAATLAVGNTTGGTSIAVSAGDGIGFNGVAAAGNQITGVQEVSSGASNLLLLGSGACTMGVVNNSIAMNGASASTLTTSGSNNFNITTGGSFSIGTNGHACLLVDTSSNIVLNNSGSALATNATNGFTYLPSCAGVPTGTPTTLPTGAPPTVIDTADGRFYAYYGGAWNSLSGSASYPLAITAQTASTTAVANTGNSNTGAAGSVTMTLPAAPAIGTVCDFYVTVAQEFEILAPGGVTIYVDTTSTGAAGFFRSNVIGSQAHCTYLATNTWLAAIWAGTWTVNS